MRNWVSRFGTPLELITDRARQFQSNLFEQLSKSLGFIKLRTTAYHPMSNGLLERQHRTLKTMLRCHKGDWITALPLVLFAMRATPLSDSNISPFTMVTGTEVLAPNLFFNWKTLQEDPISFTSKLAARMETISFVLTRFSCNGQSHVAPELQSCKQVWVKVDRVKRPLESPYSGPYDVVQRSEKFFKIRYASGKTENVSLHRLKPVIQEDGNIVKQIRRETELQEAAKTIVHDDDLNVDFVEEDEEQEIILDEPPKNVNEELPNHVKFEKKIPYKSRYGRKVRFAV